MSVVTRFKTQKSIFAKSLADQCLKEQILLKIIEAFEAIRSRIGISNSID